MIRPFTFKNKIVGEYFENEEIFCFFGNRHISFDVVKEAFSEYTFHQVKQVHGNHIIEAPAKNLTEADGHFTNKKKLALAIVTADCLPVFYITKNFAVALHCGWRGIENEIITKSKVAIQEEILYAFIGPHIKYSHFEVGNDVAQKLFAAAQNYGREKVVHPYSDPSKKLVDLQTIAYLQLNFQSVICSNIDTFDNLDWCSYRRDAERAGRNISFVTFK